MLKQLKKFFVSKEKVDLVPMDYYVGCVMESELIEDECHDVSMEYIGTLNLPSFCEGWEVSTFEGGYILLENLILKEDRDEAKVSCGEIM